MVESHGMQLNQLASTTPQPRAVLRDWYFKQKNKSSYRIILVGLDIKTIHDRLQKEFQTSVICKRLDRRVLQTDSGSVYHLEGPCNAFEMERLGGYFGSTIRAFSNGFPSVWKEFLKDDWDRREYDRSFREKTVRPLGKVGIVVSLTSQPLQQRKENIPFKAVEKNVVCVTPVVSSGVVPASKPSKNVTFMPPENRSPEFCEVRTKGAHPKDIRVENCFKQPVIPARPLPPVAEPVPKKRKVSIQKSEPKKPVVRLATNSHQMTLRSRAAPIKETPVNSGGVVAGVFKVPKRPSLKPVKRARKSVAKNGSKSTLLQESFTVSAKPSKKVKSAKKPPKVSKKPPVSKRLSPVENLISKKKGSSKHIVSVTPKPARKNQTVELNPVENKITEKRGSKTLASVKPAEPARKKNTVEINLVENIVTKKRESKATAAVKPAEPARKNRTVGWFKEAVKQVIKAPSTAKRVPAAQRILFPNSIHPSPGDPPIPAFNWADEQLEAFDAVSFTDTTRTFRMSAAPKRKAQPRIHDEFEPSNAQNAIDRLNFQGFLQQERNNRVKRPRLGLADSTGSSTFWGPNSTMARTMVNFVVPPLPDMLSEE